MVSEERIDDIESIDIARYWLVLKRRWKPALAVAVATVVAAIAAASSQKPMFEAASKVLLQRDKTAALTGVSDDLGDLEALNEQTGDPLSTQAEIIFSLPILEDTIRSLDLRDSEGVPVKPSDLAADLGVEQLDTSDVIAVSYRAEEPELAAAVVNQIVRSYIEASLRNQQSDVMAARRFVESELPRARNELERLSATLRAFNEENGIISLPDEASAMVSTIANLDNQINQAQISLVQAATDADQISRRLGMSAQQAMALATVNESPAVQSALTQLQGVRADLATALTRYTPRHPSVRALQRQELALITVVENRISEAVGGATARGLVTMSKLDRDLAEQLVQSELKRANTANQLAVLTQTRNAYKQQSDVFPRLSQTQQTLQRQLDAAKDTYEILRVRQQEIQLAENGTAGSARIVESAVPPEEATVDGWIKYVLAGAVVGGFLGVATAFFLDLIDRSIKTVKDAEKVFGYVLLGVIPHFKLPEDLGEETEFFGARDTIGEPAKRVVTWQGRYPILSGAYQMLQANLRFIRSDKKLKVLAMTSSVAGEGKSEVCANLAASVAQTNRRVLLVDADMRMPSQHHLWNLINSVGLSHVLVGEGDLEKALHSVSDNLTVLTAGVVPPNPMALLDSERMAELIERFREEFDYIIFDTPSLSGSADGAVLGSMVDGVLMVTRPFHVSYDRAMAAKTLLDRSGATVLGMIANGVDSKKDFGEYSYDMQELADSTSNVALSERDSLAPGQQVEEPVGARSDRF